MKETDLRFNPSVVVSDTELITIADLVADYEIPGEVFFVQGVLGKTLTVVTARGNERQWTFTSNEVRPCMVKKVIYNGAGDTATTFVAWI